MLNLLRRKPRRENHSKTVPTRRFNDMIIYYTKELKARLHEIQVLKRKNHLLTQTAVQSTKRHRESHDLILKLKEENRRLRK